MENVSKQSTEKRRLEEAESLLGKKIKHETEDVVEVMSTAETEIYTLEDIVESDDIKTEIVDDIITLDLRNTNKQAVEKSRILLRRDVMEWLNSFLHVQSKNVIACVEALLRLRIKYRGSNRMWYDEVICLREVQRKITSAVDHLHSMNEQQQKCHIAQTLREILQPYKEIKKIDFPNIRLVTTNIYRACHNPAMSPFPIRSIRQLPDKLSTKLQQDLQVSEEYNSKMRTIQESLETTVQLHAENNLDYQCLLCIVVLRLFGFSLNGWLFEHELSKNNLEMITKMLESHMEHLETTENEKQKQAYVMNLALYSTGEREKTIQFLISMMNENMCNELREASKHRNENNRMDTKLLQSTVDTLLQDKQHELNLPSLMESMKSQLHFLGYQKKAKPTVGDQVVIELDGCTRERMNLLGMEKYYPQKLKYSDITMLRVEALQDGSELRNDGQEDVGGNIQDDVIKKPTSLLELPMYFINGIMALDSETRERCFLAHDDDDDSSDDDSDREDAGAIHPLDLVYIIFLCADDFLRHELADKMSKCQYAVPFVLPSPLVKNSCNKDLVLHFALKGIVRNFACNNIVMNEPLADVEAPMVAFVSIGQEVAWKTKLLNKMLSTQQETFWHKGLKGGNRRQLISQRMVEVAWYLPGVHGNNIFTCPVTFANLRISASESDETCDALVRFSSICCIFVDNINQDLVDFVRTKNLTGRLLLVVLYQDKEVKQKSKHLQETLDLERHQVICKKMDEANFHPVQEQLKKSIQIMTQIGPNKLSLSKFAMQRKKDGRLKVDDEGCYIGYMAAETILKDVDEHNAKKPRSAKGAILPCHSDLKSRQDIAALDKELCRQKKLILGNTTVQSYAFSVKEQKWILQLNQLHYPISDTFRYFLQCLVGLYTEDRHYFLQSLKLGLNKRSIQMLQPLYEEYEKWRIQDESIDRDEKLQQIDDQISNGSLGVEHFFRELAVVYENLDALKIKSNLLDIDVTLDKLVYCVAELLTEGIAIEILDSDSMDVPVSWLNAVFLAVENCSKSTLFKVSALGAQSSGKSTLLNTIFRSNFPVSSGRCTRGAFLQLVKLEDSLREILNCHYVAVIDSEGLMSRTRFGYSDFDNELSTFIIGISDLTLVVIKGEGSEMQEVLPLAIHVFLRMNTVGEHYQSVHFIHQNLSAVDAREKGSTEIEAFVRDLNDKTFAAAKQAGQGEQYSKFTDVLQYKSTTDNTYVQSLWDGSPPMGKINVHYSWTMQKLKWTIIRKIKDLHSNQQKRLGSFVDLTKRLEELWDAVKYENFVFSFRNVLAIEAHKNLTKIFDEKQWALKRQAREIMQKEKRTIEDKMLKNTSDEAIGELIKTSKQQVTGHLFRGIQDTKMKILHYFRCTGCGDCSTTVKNRHLLANNEKEFLDEVNILWSTLEDDVESFLLNMEIKVKTDESVRELSMQMNSILKRKVQEAIQNRHTEDVTEQQVQDWFEDLWKKSAADIQRLIKRKEKMKISRQRYRR